MINLIPPNAQKQVRNEYWVRVVSVWLLLLGTSFIIVVILFAPVYVLIQSQLDSYWDEYTRANGETQSFKDAESEIKKANELATLLSKSKNIVTFSGTIESLEKLTKDEVIIESYSLTRKGDVIDSIIVVGQADSRLALTQFKDSIENEPMFESVTLPLSNLAKDKDIPFSITIIPSGKSKQQN